MSKPKRYYWLKLQKDFFKRPDIKIIESQPDGILYCYFYMKLLLESLEMQGILRYNDVPLDINMLSALTNTSVSIVRSAIDIFLKMNMIEILEDGSLYLSEVVLLLDSETEDARRKRAKKEELKIEGKTKKVPMTTAERVKKFRDKQKLEISLKRNVTKCNENVTKVVTKCNEKNVTCNENVTENVTEKPLKSIDNKRINDVTENFRKISIEQEQEQEKDIYTCHDHEEKILKRDMEIEKLFHELGVNYTNKNVEAVKNLLNELGDKELLKKYLKISYEKLRKNNYGIKNIAGLFSSSLKTIDSSLVNYLLKEEEIKLKRDKENEEKIRKEEEMKKEEEEIQLIFEELNNFTVEEKQKIFMLAEQKIKDEKRKKSIDTIKNLSGEGRIYLKMMYKQIKEVLRESV